MKLGSNARVAGGAAKGLLWILLIGVVAGGAYLVLEKQKSKPVEPALALATPAPAIPTPTPEPATPAPAVVKATPTPLPVAVVATPTPLPTPPPLDVATVVRTPALWPPQVALLQPYPFPVVLNGKVVGDAKAPVGTVLRVLRVGGQQVEVEFQSARHVLPLTATDLMARATATFRKNGSILPSAPPPTVMATPPPATPPTTANPLQGPVKIGERLVAEVVRNKRSRIEGGDWDDKRERIEMKVKVTNTDPKMTADKLKGEIYVFGESILDRTAVKLLTSQNFDFSLPVRGTHEFTTDEVVTMYDTTGARFGHKYEGWVLRLRDGSGNLVLIKASSPGLQRLVEKASSLTKDKTYDRSTAGEKSEVRAMR